MAFHTVILIAVLATSTPSSAVGQPIALTDEIVAIATAKACGYSFDRAQAIENAYGEAQRKAYQREFDVSPKKYAEILSSSSARLTERLESLSPSGQKYFFTAPAKVYPSESKPGFMSLSVTQVLTGYPGDFCRTGRAKKFISSLGDMDVCRTAVQPWQFVHDAPTLSWGYDLLEFVIPDSVDSATVLGGSSGDRAAIVQIEGTFSGCINDSKSARFVPTRMLIFGTNHGAAWFVNTRRDIKGLANQSVYYTKYARTPIKSMEFSKR